MLGDVVVLGLVEAVDRVDDLHDVARVLPAGVAVGVLVGELHQGRAVAADRLAHRVDEGLPRALVVHRGGDAERGPALGEPRHRVVAGARQRAVVDALEEGPQALHDAVDRAAERAVALLDAEGRPLAGGELEALGLAEVDLLGGEVGGDDAVEDHPADLAGNRSA